MPSKRKSPLGHCFLCGRTYSKAGMVRHLRKHLQERRGDTPLAWLRVTDDTPWAVLPSSSFWLDLEVPLDLSLEILDTFLRAVWVECCGHLSHFVVTYRKFKIYFVPEHEFDSSYPDLTKDDLEKEIQQYGKPVADASAPLWLRFSLAFPSLKIVDLPARLFTVGDLIQMVDEFVYKYDFGTTTRLKLRVQAQYTGPRPEEEMSIRVLSRNFKPRISCEMCDKPAEFLVMDAKGILRPLCRRHTDEASHQGEVGMRLPLVNSPRTGLCGYDGPYQEKWKFEVFPPK